MKNKMIINTKDKLILAKLVNLIQDRDIFLFERYRKKFSNLTTELTSVENIGKRKPRRITQTSKMIITAQKQKKDMMLYIKLKE